MPGSVRRRRLVVGGSLVVSFLLLAVVNFLFTRATLPYDVDSRLGKVVRYLWHESSQSTDSPVMLFAGSSRLQTCILPDVFASYAEAMGVNAKFINISQPGMGYWESSKILEWVDSRAMGIRVCVVEVSPWAFNRRRRHPVTKEVVLYERELDAWGSFSDAWAVEGFPLKTRLMARLLFPRKSVKGFWNILKGIQSGGPHVSELLPPEIHEDKTMELKVRNNPTYFAENISQCHLMDYTFSASKRNRFLAFIEGLEKQGMEVILVQLPVKEDYYNYVKNDGGRRQEYQKHLQFMDDLSSHYRVFYWPLAEDVGLDDSVFVDYGHFSFEGAFVFSNLLAEQIHDTIEDMRVLDNL